MFTQELILNTSLTVPGFPFTVIPNVTFKNFPYCSSMNREVVVLLKITGWLFKDGDLISLWFKHSRSTAMSGLTDTSITRTSLHTVLSPKGGKKRKY